MRPRNRSIAWGSLVAVTVTLLLAACGGGGTGSTTGEQQGGATMPTTPADPLEGEWRAEFTCEDMVKTLERVGKAEFAPDLLVQDWGIDDRPSKADPCATVREPREIVVRFGGGRLVLFVNGEIGDDNPYTVVDDTFILPPDLHFRFQIDGERLTVDNLEDDPGYVSAWEVAPFERVS
jgi:hypothetical protein